MKTLIRQAVITVQAVMLMAWPVMAYAADKQPENWLVVYQGTHTITDLYDVDMLVLEAEQGHDVRSLVAQGQTVLAYISLGEVEQYRDYYQTVKNSGAVLHENKNWPGSFYVDIRNPEWARVLIEEAIPELLRMGYSGLMFDTLDNAIFLAQQDGGKDGQYAGMDTAAVRLVKAIRHHYPDIHIMVNRGVEILPQIAADINSVLAESTYTMYDFDTKKPVKLKAPDRRYYTEALAKAKQANPSLKIYSLDYWNPDDKKGVAEIYKAQQKQGYIPYVSTVELDEIFKWSFSKHE